MLPILQRRATRRDSFTIAFMSLRTAVRHLRNRPWTLELGAAAVGLLFGLILMPVLIFYTGVATLGRYEGASLKQIFANLYEGLAQGSTASWVVFVGPYGLYVLGKGLRGWWRASAKLN
jgi:hypothetical protein